MFEFISLFTPVFAFDPLWLGHSIIGFVGQLLLPVLVLVVLTGIMGGDAKGFGDAVVDALGTAVILIFDLSLALAKSIFTALMFVLGAVLRTLAERKSVNLKVGDGPEYGGTNKKQVRSD
jgi:hypothetical protein